MKREDFREQVETALEKSDHVEIVFEDQPPYSGGSPCGFITLRKVTVFQVSDGRQSYKESFYDRTLEEALDGIINDFVIAVRPRISR